LRLTPFNNTDCPVDASTNTIQLAPPMAYIDFGFIELGLLAALPGLAQPGDKHAVQVAEVGYANAGRHIACCGQFSNIFIADFMLGKK
jgi:hypothetical protein